MIFLVFLGKLGFNFANISVFLFCFGVVGVCGDVGYFVGKAVGWLSWVVDSITSGVVVICKTSILKKSQTIKINSK